MHVVVMVIFLEIVRVVLFVGAVFAVFAMAASILIQRMRSRQSPRILGKTIPVRLRRAILFIAAVGVGCVGYGFIEPYRLSISRVTVPTSKLAQGLQPIRIVHLSDIHSDATVRLEKEIPAVVAGMKPDLICFTGDAFNSSSGIPNFRALMSALTRIAPTFVVQGNWDRRSWRRFRPTEGLNLTELNGTAIRAEIRGTPVWISGLATNNVERLTETLNAVPRDQLSVFLFHYPDLIVDVAGKGPDLYLAGHTHGGQIALPLFGAILTRSKFGKRYEAGLYREQETYLYVSRGIGMGSGLPRVRFLAPPEVVVLDLVPSPTRF